MDHSMMIMMNKQFSEKDGGSYNNKKKNQVFCINIIMLYPYVRM